jgi:hypothetical protein
MNMNRRNFGILALTFAVALSGCREGATGVTNGVVTVVLEGDALRIRNSGNQARAFAAYDANWLALASTSDFTMLALCNTTDAACLRLPAYGSILVPLTDVGGYSASTTHVTVWTWRVLPVGEGAGLQPVTDETIQLKL